MPRQFLKTAVLTPDTRAQLKDLFGTGPNAHRCLGLEPVLSRAEMVAALAGWPIKPEIERYILTRWQEWRAKFLLSPVVTASAASAEMMSRDISQDVFDTILNDLDTGNYYDPAARDPETGALVIPGVRRFTLITVPK